MRQSAATDRRWPESGLRFVSHSTPPRATNDTLFLLSFHSPGAVPVRIIMSLGEHVRHRARPPLSCHKEKCPEGSVDTLGQQTHRCQPATAAKATSTGSETETEAERTFLMATGMVCAPGAHHLSFMGQCLRCWDSGIIVYGSEPHSLCIVQDGWQAGWPVLCPDPDPAGRRAHL